MVGDTANRSIIRLNLAIRSGATRHVLLVHQYAVKFPAFMNGWELFLCGLLGNVQERKFSGSEAVFCPVVFYTWGGFMSVMKRADILTEKQFDEMVTDSFISSWGCDLPCEIKASSFGLLNGDVVCTDYGS